MADDHTYFVILAEGGDPWPTIECQLPLVQV